jgi:VIT1/CCC1 family predicted Fe2+/Mn2+ transporter
VVSRGSQIEKASMTLVHNKERHRTGRIGWLRAAVLGANDGILSTSSLVLGVAAAHALTHWFTLLDATTLTARQNISRSSPHSYAGGGLAV